MRRTMAGLLLALSISVSAAASHTYTVGVVPQYDARTLHATWQPILARVGEELGHRFVLKGANDIPSFEAAYRRGDYDFVYLNPWHAVMAWEVQAYQPILRDRSRELHGVLVVHRDSDIRTLDDLQGEEIVFPAPNAMGASLLMRAELTCEHGLSFHPVYVGNHASVYLNVAVGAAEAGGGIFATLHEQPAALKSRLRILHRTRGMKPHPISVHPRVPAALVQAFVRSMIGLADNLSMRRHLVDIPMQEIGRADITEYLPLQTWGLQAFHDPG